MLATPGRVNEISSPHGESHAMVSSVDDNYMVIGFNIDASIKQKFSTMNTLIFARLLPKDRVVCQEDHCMEIVNKGGYTYFVLLQTMSQVEAFLILADGSRHSVCLQIFIQSSSQTVLLN